MKKTILMIFIGIAIFTFSTTSCKKNSALDCGTQALEFLEALSDFDFDPTVSTCNALKKAAEDYLKSCKKFMEADKIDDIEDLLDEIGGCDA